MRTPAKTVPPPPPTIERLVCEHCDYVCFTAIHLSRHAAVHTKTEKTSDVAEEAEIKFTCPRCPFSSVKRSELRSHLLRGHPGRHVLRTFRCPYCTFESLDSPSTEDHVDQQHPGQKCVFEVNRDVLVHVDQPPSCLLCEEKFALACLLRVHIIDAHGEGSLDEHKSVALEDDYTFPEYTVEPTAEALTEEDKEDEEDSIPDPVPPVGNIAKFHCDFCEFDTNDFPLFDNHMMSTHGEEVAKEHRELHPRAPSPEPSAAPVSPPLTPTPSSEGGDDDSRPYKCSHCPYSAQSAKSLWSHNKNHDR